LAQRIGFCLTLTQVTVYLHLVAEIICQSAMHISERQSVKTPSDLFRLHAHPPVL